MYVHVYEVSEWSGLRLCHNSNGFAFVLRRSRSRKSYGRNTSRFVFRSLFQADNKGLHVLYKHRRAMSPPGNVFHLSVYQRRATVSWGYWLRAGSRHLFESGLQPVACNSWRWITTTMDMLGFTLVDVYAWTYVWMYVNMNVFLDVYMYVCISFSLLARSYVVKDCHWDRCMRSALQLRTNGASSVSSTNFEQSLHSS